MMCSELQATEVKAELKEIGEFPAIILQRVLQCRRVFGFLNSVILSENVSINFRPKLYIGVRVCE